MLISSKNIHIFLDFISCSIILYCSSLGIFFSYCLLSSSFILSYSVFFSWIKALSSSFISSFIFSIKSIISLSFVPEWIFIIFIEFLFLFLFIKLYAILIKAVFPQPVSPIIITGTFDLSRIKINITLIKLSWVYI